MAAPNPAKAYLNSGRLAYNCTDLSTAYPHGGTALGLFGNVILRPPHGKTLLMEEETGAPSAVLWRGGTLMLAGICKGWDNDALGVIWPNTTTGSSGDKVIQWPGSTVVPGVALTPLTNVVFSPVNPDYPAIVLIKPVAVPDIDLQVKLSAYRYMDVPCVFIATTAGSSYGSMGLLDDLTL